MASERSRTLRGALAGAVAAGVWAAQQPLDRRVFGASADDARLLARLAGVSYPVGMALHVVNGGLLGALYANLAPHLPLPARLRGPLFGLGEHLLTWPAAVALQPEVSPLGAVFAQATWRHLLFGAVLGELEGRLNLPDEERGPVDPDAVASNGHGSADHLVATG